MQCPHLHCLSSLHAFHYTHSDRNPLGHQHLKANMAPQNLSPAKYSARAAGQGTPLYHPLLAVTDLLPHPTPLGGEDKGSASLNRDPQARKCDKRSPTIAPYSGSAWPLCKAGHKARRAPGSWQRPCCLLLSLHSKAGPLQKVLGAASWAT